jgi:DNA-binding CsgD family transcriptional regulator
VNSSAPRVSEEVIRFVNELPTQGDPVTWIIQFRDALKRLLGDVDHIVMSVSADADVHRQRVKPVIRLTRNVNLGNGQGDEMHYTINREMSPSAIHLEDGIRAGFPIGKYHQPHLYDYYIGAEHMGSIILLRERTAKPISAETLTLMEELRPFFIFALSDCVARQHKGHTPERYFSDYFSDMVAKESKLTLREQEVLTLRLIGAKYSEIADRLCISIDTVRKHVKSIHAKTNTRTLADLLAYYFKSSKE